MDRDGGVDGDDGDCSKDSGDADDGAIVIVVMVMMKAPNTHWLPVQFQGERPNIHSHLQSLAQRCWHQFPFTNEQSKAVGGHLAQNRISSNSRARA